MVYELVARNIGMKSLMGNSITTSFYYCEDSNYTLNDNKCIKQETAQSNILGDVNLDNVVDNSDLDLLNKYLAKTVDLSENIYPGDISQGKRWERSDIRML